jgi:hypothetical protein
LGFQCFFLYILKEFLQSIISILLFHFSNLGTEYHVSWWFHSTWAHIKKYGYNKIILNLYKFVNWIVNSSWSDETIFFKIFFLKKLKIKYILIELSKLNCIQLPSNLIWKPTWINIRWTNNKMNLYSRTGLNSNC